MEDLDVIAKALIGLSGTGGGVVAAIMFYMWRSANEERKALQSQQTELLKGTIESRLQLATALEKIIVKIGA